MKWHVQILTQNIIVIIFYRSIAAARLSELGPSRFVVGSSRAKIPQLRQNVSAKARRIMREART